MAPITYMFWNYDYIVNRIYYVDDMTPADMAMAVILIVLLLEATRRLIGWALPLTAIAFLAYGLLVARVEPMRLLDQLFMTTEGVFGTASWACRAANCRGSARRCGNAAISSCRC